MLCGANFPSHPTHLRSRGRFLPQCVSKVAAQFAHTIAEVLQTVISPVTVDVVEDQGHPPAMPQLVLPTQLALPLLDAFLEQALLEVTAAERGVLDQDFLEGLAAPVPREGLTLHSSWIEVIRRDGPPLCVLLERAGISTVVPIAE